MKVIQEYNRRFTSPTRNRILVIRFTDDASFATREAMQEIVERARAAADQTGSAFLVLPHGVEVQWL